MDRQLIIEFPEPADEVVRSDFLRIAGLTYVAGLLSTNDQERILKAVDEQPWRSDLKRRVQHYGYRYDYKARTVDPSMYVGPLPAFGIEVARLLLEQNLVSEMPDQLIVNEYEPGQGISAHVDCVPCFKDTIVTVSLGSVYQMDFIDTESSEVRSAPLALGSAVIMRDKARYGWMHRIAARKSDGHVRRERRVSLTFRNVILQTSPGPGSVGG